MHQPAVATSSTPDSRLLTAVVSSVFIVVQVTLEQYPTSPELTAAVVLSALERDDVGVGRSVCDLGCGTAMLSLGWYVVCGCGCGVVVLTTILLTFNLWHVLLQRFGGYRFCIWDRL